MRKDGGEGGRDLGDIGCRLQMAVQSDSWKCFSPSATTGDFRNKSDVVRGEFRPIGGLDEWYNSKHIYIGFERP